MGTNDDAAAMTIPFVDLAAQQSRIRADLDQRIARVLDHGRYVLGPEVAELEGKLAGRAGCRVPARRYTAPRPAVLSAIRVGDSARRLGR